MHLRGRQPPLRFNGHVGVARQRHHVAVAIRSHPQPLLPPRLRRRRLLRTHADPAGPDSHEGPRIAGFAGHVVDLPGLHLRPLRDERHWLLAIEQDSPRGDLVAESGGAGLELRAGRAGHHGRALGLDFYRLETTAGRRGGAVRGRFRLAGQHDREQVARELFGGAVGSGADHIDMILECDHVGRDVHAQRAAARDEHRRRGRRSVGGGCGGGGGRRRPGQHAPRDSLDSHLHVTIETNRVDTTDVGPLVTGAGAPSGAAPTGSRPEPRYEPAAAPARPAVAELHHLASPDLEFIEFDVAGDDLHVVLGLGRGGRAPNRHLAAEAAADQPRKSALAEVEWLVELEHGPLRRPQHHGAAWLAVGSNPISVRQHDERAGHEVHAAVRQRVVVLEEEPHLPALEHDRVISLPRSGRKHVAKGREPLVGAGADRRGLLRCHFERRRGISNPWLDDRHHGEPIESRRRQGNEKHSQRPSESMFHHRLTVGGNIRSAEPRSGPRWRPSRHEP